MIIKILIKLIPKTNITKDKKINKLHKTNWLSSKNPLRIIQIKYKILNFSLA
jgi:hypothetical protein